MRNPWLDLPRAAPLVLPEDSDTLNRFNQTAKDSTRVHLELLPEPFLGDPDAPVVVLALNPGFSTDDFQWHSDPTFAQLSRDNLEHRASDHPFYLLNPKICGPGRRWWERRLSLVLEIVPQQVVANRLLCVEYFGYHSAKFNCHRLHLPSQEYAFYLVHQALSRRALIVLTRGERVWLEAVPELKTYPRLFRLRSVQNTVISPRNCNDFEAVIAELRGS